jgi:hypothetical protein
MAEHCRLLSSVEYPSGQLGEVCVEPLVRGYQWVRHRRTPSKAKSPSPRPAVRLTTTATMRAPCRSRWERRSSRSWCGSIHVATRAVGGRPLSPPMFDCSKCTSVISVPSCVAFPSASLTPRGVGWMRIDRSTGHRLVVRVPPRAHQSALAGTAEVILRSGSLGFGRPERTALRSTSAAPIRLVAS